MSEILLVDRLKLDFLIARSAARLTPDLARARVVRMAELAEAGPAARLAVDVADALRRDVLADEVQRRGAEVGAHHVLMRRADEGGGCGPVLRGGEGHGRASALIAEAETNSS